MDVKHFNELIEVSQKICDNANDQIANYCAQKYCAVESDSTEQQLRDYLFIAEGEPLLTASGGNLKRGEVNRNKRAAWVRNARKTVRWTVFSGERAAALGESRDLKG